MTELSASDLQLLIVGLDGGTFEVIKPLIAAGKLPVLGGLMKSGCHGKLRSVMPPYTPVAWSTIMTGCNPGKHGIYYFSELKPGTYEPRMINGSDIAVPTMWEVLDGRGLRCGLFNIPWTYPPLKLNGFCVSGMDAPRFDRTMAHPAEMFERVRDAGKVGGLNLNLADTDTEEAAWELIAEHIDVTGSIMREMVVGSGLDVFMPVFMQSDCVGHAFWHSEDDMAADEVAETLLGRTYSKIDEQIGELLGVAVGPNTTILVVSDHGFRSIRGTLCVNRWLEELGMLRFVGRPGEQGVTFKAGQQLFKRLPRRWKQAVRGRFWSRRLRRQSMLRDAGELFDWEYTQAFCTTEYGGITVNVRGRQPHGIVAPDGGVEQVRRRLEDAARQLLDPDTGEPVIEDVLTREGLFSGPQLHRAPDLWLKARDDACYLALNWMGSWAHGADAVFTAERPPIGGHDPDGIFIAAGAGVGHIEQPLEGLQLEQVAPTVAHRFGLPMPQGTDGAPVREVFPGEFADAVADSEPAVSAHPGNEPQEYTPEEAAMIEKRLRDLGYL